MSSSGAEPLLPAGRFAPHRREHPGAILGTNFANSACAIACRSMVYRWLRIQVSAVSVYRTRDERNALAAANDRALDGAVYSAALALTPQHVVERKDGKTGSLVLYVLARVAVVVGVDVLFFRNRFWERLIVNVGIVLVFAASYLRFLMRPWPLATAVAKRTQRLHGVWD